MSAPLAFIYDLFNNPLFIFIGGLVLLGVFFWYLGSDQDKVKRNAGTIFIIGIASFSLFSLFQQGLKYGIDIAGGVSFTLSVEPNIGDDGKPIPLNNPRKCLDAQLAFVSEDRRGVGLLLDETLEWNVAFPAMQIQNKFLKKYGPITWRDTRAIHDVTQEYIDELKIKCTSSKQKARELSGGNQQKVCLAKAFALQPRFLFVSEPTRGIDVGAKALVLDALKKFNRENGVTVVMISSELEELRTTCDRIAIVSGGRIVGILPATESSETFGALMVSQVK